MKEKTIFLFLLLTGVFFSLNSQETNEETGWTDYTDYNVNGFNSKIKIVKKNNSYDTITNNGKLIVPFSYNSSNNYSYKTDLFKVFQKNKVGIINKEYQFLIPIDYDDISKFKNYTYSFLKTKLNGKYGAVNWDNSQIIIKNKFKDIQWHKQHFFVIEKKNGQIGVIDKNGQSKLKPIIADEIVDYVLFLDEISYFIFKLKDKYGLVQSSGSILIKPDYKRYIWEHDCNVFIAINEDKKVGIINYNGKIIVPIIYEDMIYHNPKYVLAKKDGKYGAVDIYNNQVLPFTFDDIILYSLSNNSCEPKLFSTQKGKLALVELDGTFLTESIYDKILDYRIKSCFFRTVRHNKWGVIDENGKTILDNSFDEIKETFNNRIIASKNSFYSLYDTSGIKLTTTEFNGIDFISSYQYLAFKLNDKYGLINYEGKIIQKPIFDKIIRKDYNSLSIHGIIDGKRRVVIEEK